MIIVLHCTHVSQAAAFQSHHDEFSFPMYPVGFLLPAIFHPTLLFVDGFFLSNAAVVCH
jgi:hypothetical protein